MEFLGMLRGEGGRDGDGDGRDLKGWLGDYGKFWHVWLCLCLFVCVFAGIRGS